MVLALSAWTSAGAADCPVAVSLEGDALLAAEVQGELTRDGVTTVAGPSCSAVSVTLSRCEGGIRMTVIDSMRPTEERVVSDTAVAASFIESWVRHDLDEPLLHGTEVGEATSRIPGSSSLDPEMLEMQPPSSEPTARRSFAVSAFVSATVAQDGSTWIDPALRACLSFGPVCTGVTIRGRFDLGVSGDSSRFESERAGVDMMLSAGMPIGLGKVDLTPSIGVGGGWLHTRFSGDASREGAVARESAGIRLEARLALAMQLGAPWAMLIATRFLASPFARATPSMDGGALLAGEPRWSFSAGVGLRYGGAR